MSLVNRKDFSVRFNKALDYRKYPELGRGRIQAVQDLFELSNTGAHKWLTGISMPRHKKIDNIAQKLGVNAEWLEYGSGSMLDISETYQFKDNIHKIPIYTPINISSHSIEEISETLSYKDKEEIKYDINELIAMEIFSETMEPIIRRGSQVIIHTNLPIDEGDYVVYTINNSPEADVRQLRKGMENYLVSSNTKLHAIKYSDCNIIGKVIEVRFSL